MTRPKSNAALRLLAVLITLSAIAAHQYLPQKILLLYPDGNEERFAWIFGPTHSGEPSIDWIDETTNHFWCNYLPGDNYSCGWSLNLGANRINGIDLSDFDGFNILLHYKGDAPRVRLNLRDFDPAYSDIDRFDVTSKVMSTTVRTSDLNKPVYVHLSEFSVAEWWITEFDIAGQHSAPSLNNTIAIGVDFNVHSQNEVRVERIEAVGEWIKKETLYFAIISFWMALIVLEVLWRFYSVHKQAKADAQRINNLVHEYKKLEVEKQEFEALSTTDVLTGVMNRAGVQQFLQHLFESDFSRNQMGVLLFDIDHFKNINDQLGHDVGDVVLCEVARIINNNVRHTDIFGRWGGEEFILVASQIQEERLRVLADKLRETIALHPFEVDGQSITVTVSIGATTVAVQESFETVFKRVDTALYKAKDNGRNQVTFVRP
jgi:diguanylate cyclase (GGDEF)-like protein